MSYIPMKPSEHGNDGLLRGWYQSIRESMQPHATTIYNSAQGLADRAKLYFSALEERVGGKFNNYKTRAQDMTENTRQFVRDVITNPRGALEYYGLMSKQLEMARQEYHH